MPPCTGTHVGIGIESAIDQLDSYVPSPDVIGQAIIIVGDGKPLEIGQSDPQIHYPESDYYGVCDGRCEYDHLVQMANLAADEAEENGYDVFIVCRILPRVGAGRRAIFQNPRCQGTGGVGARFVFQVRGHSARHVSGRRHSIHGSLGITVPYRSVMV